MSVLITALDGPTVHTDPSAELLSKWAYEKHTETCAECRRGDTWCAQGRAFLRATQPAADLPGFPSI